MKKLMMILPSVASAFLMSACSESLPKCGNKEDQDTLAEVINNAFKAESIKFIHSKNHKEIGFNKEKEIRVCMTDIMISNGDEEKITYNISWENKKKQTFWVEIVN